jgi:hypothetical protein
VFWSAFLCCLPIYLSKAERANAIPPVKIGTEKEVPYFCSHFVGIELKPSMFSPSNKTSGLAKPTPFKRDRFVMPRELKYATSSNVLDREPTPITDAKSPGFSALPY